MDRLCLSTPPEAYTERSYILPGGKQIPVIYISSVH